MSEVELKKLIAHFALSNRAEGKSPKTEAWYAAVYSQEAIYVSEISKTFAGVDRGERNI